VDDETALVYARVVRELRRREHRALPTHRRSRHRAVPLSRAPRLDLACASGAYAIRRVDVSYLTGAVSVSRS
jgi:hypothetical protein